MAGVDQDARRAQLRAIPAGYYWLIEFDMRGEECWALHQRGEGDERIFVWSSRSDTLPGSHGVHSLMAETVFVDGRMHTVARHANDIITMLCVHDHHELALDYARRHITSTTQWG